MVNLYGRLLLVASLFCFSAIVTTGEKIQSHVLFENVSIFDGKTDKLHTNMHVLVSDNKISEISAEPLAVIQSTNMKRVFGAGLVMVPGLVGSMPGALEVDAVATFYIADLDPGDLLGIAEGDIRIKLIMKDGVIYKNTLGG